MRRRLFLWLRAPSVRPSRPQAFQNFFAGLPDVAGAQREHEVAIGGGGEQRVHAAIESAHILDAAVPELADAIGQRLRR